MILAVGVWYGVCVPLFPDREARLPTLTIPYTTDAERLALEQAIAFVTDLRRLALDAPSGAVLDACEAVALHGGRQLLRDALAAAVQARAAAADAQKKRPASATKAPTTAGC